MVRIRQGPYECPSGSEDRACNADGIESGSSFAATEVRIRQGPSFITTEPAQPSETSRYSITTIPMIVPSVATRSWPLTCVSGTISSLMTNSIAPAAKPIA